MKDEKYNFALARTFTGSTNGVTTVAFGPDDHVQKILEWQKEQDFKICPNPDDPDACNVYNEITFPDEVYEDIQEYREEQQVADS